MGRLRGLICNNMDAILSWCNVIYFVTTLVRSSILGLVFITYMRMYNTPSYSKP